MLQVDSCVDKLERSVRVTNDACAQRFVSGNNRIESLFQGGDIQRTSQPCERSDVIQRAVGFQLIKEPQTLLGERKWRKAPVCRLAQTFRKKRTLARKVWRRLDSFAHVPIGS